MTGAYLARPGRGDPDGLPAMHSASTIIRSSRCATAGPVLAGSAAQVGEDGEDAPVVVIGRLQAETQEDGRRVLGDSALGDNEPLGDGGVRAGLGHQGEYLALAGAERGEEAAAGIAGRQAGYHFRVHHGAARGDPAHRLGELRTV